VRPRLAADCVSKSFGGRRVLASASLRAQPGEVRALLGRNGIGKSTLMRIAGGLHQPDAGIVLFDGAPLLKASLAHLARAGLFYLPDHDLLSDAFPLGRQLDLFAQRFGQRTATEAATLAQVAHLLAARPGSLSGGERRRAELAVALTRRPTVLLADEPFRGIAPVDHEMLARLFRALADEGCAVVLSGHEVPTLLDLADHVTWCVAGTTYELGPPAAARRHEPFRLDYLGPMSPRP
jgi:ABC-type multidrug transport system ATPase subunit